MKGSAIKSRPLNNTLTAVPGVLVGHTTLPTNTGCTAILIPEGASVGSYIPGVAPTTTNSDITGPLAGEDRKIHGINLHGGANLGNETASGVAKFLLEKKWGYITRSNVQIPIVPGAGIFDNVFSKGHFPLKRHGYLAAKNATNAPVEQGNKGAFTGATVGKLAGHEYAMKSGVGSAAFVDEDTGVVVGVLVGVNALGDIIDPKTQKIIAGMRNAENTDFADAKAMLLRREKRVIPDGASQNTTLGVVATNVALDKVQLRHLAIQTFHAYVRTTSPAATRYDGDTIFTLSTGTNKQQVDPIGFPVLVEHVMEQAILNAIYHAEPLGGLPSARSFSGRR